MPDDLWDRDVLLWSEREAELLRRLARGDRVNDAAYWDRVIEEIEDVGRSQLRDVRRLLRRALEHLAKAAAWPATRHIEGWLSDARTFLLDARLDCTPSMLRQIDLAAPWRLARREALADPIDGASPGPVAAECPFALAELLPRDPEEPIDARRLAERLRTG